MQANFGTFAAGYEAVKKGEYQEAIQLLETFCQSYADTSSKDYLQAQMWLVKAYQGSGEIEKAIALCRQMAKYEQSQVASWAEKILPKLIAQRQTELQAKKNSPKPAKQKDFLLEAGKQALKQRRYSDAVQALEEFLKTCEQQNSNEYSQAQILLIKAWKGSGELEKAHSLCQQLLESSDPLVKSWAEQTLPSLVVRVKSQKGEREESSQKQQQIRLPKAGRAIKTGVKLTIARFAGNLGLASIFTISLLLGMVFVLCLEFTYIVKSENSITFSQNPINEMGIAIALTILFNIIIFFLSPILMDITQEFLYGTQWVTLAQIERRSPEAGRVIRQVCKQKNIEHPRLGIINDQNPTAFTYGSLPNNARIVVSEGLFTYLDDDEIATVYAHELGHIVHWDFVIISLVVTLLQIIYLIYRFANYLHNSIDNNQVKRAVQTAATTAYFFYEFGNYLILYLSRTREYFADHFAAEVTGNPNGLSRALVKIAYGLVQEGNRAQKPSTLIQGIRALGIYDHKAAAISGTAYSIASNPQEIGKIFLWDMFNPWGWWMELSSTHPLTGKRIRALSTYAEQLGLETEFDMARVVREGKKLSKKRLYGSFLFDMFIYRADWLIGVSGLIGSLWLSVFTRNWQIFFFLWFSSIGIGILLKNIFMFPQLPKAAECDIMKLMCDPYASPLRGRFVQLQGQVIGRGDAGYKLGSELKFQDQTGCILLRFKSRLGGLGNLLFGAMADSLIGSQGVAIGWFRRGVTPWMDLFKLKLENGMVVNSYPRFWNLVIGFGAIILGWTFPVMIQMMFRGMAGA